MVSRRNPGEGDNPHPRSLMISNIQTKQPIVGVSHIFQASVGWIIGDARWELLCRFSHGTGFLVSSCLFQPHRFVDERFVFGVSLASGSFGVRWDERLFDVLV